jgi:hypothetical protein
VSTSLIIYVEQCTTHPTCPIQRAFHSACQLLLPSHTYKTRETAWKVGNRTVWMNNKAFKFKMRPYHKCQRCGEIETMEHLLCYWSHYSQLVWIQLDLLVTQFLNINAQGMVLRVELGQLKCIHCPPSLVTAAHSRQTNWNALLIKKEIKRDIRGHNLLLH